MMGATESGLSPNPKSPNPQIFNHEDEAGVGEEEVGESQTGVGVILFEFKNNPNLLHHSELIRMTNGTCQVQPMAEIPPATTSLTTYIDDDPTLPKLTMTNGFLVPVIDSTDENLDSGPVPCQYYTVTSFCQNPKHLDLNYANQHQFTWNDVIPAISTFVVNQKHREIIHKIHIEGNNLYGDGDGDEENRPIGQVNHEVNFPRNKRERAWYVVNLILAPIRRNRKKSTPPPSHPVKATSVPPSVELRAALRRSEPSPPPTKRNIPIAPPRNRNLSNFRSSSSSQSKESLEFQSSPAPPPYPGNGSSPPSGSWTRKRSSVPSIVDRTEEILTSQFERKERLRLAVQSKHVDLTNLRREVQFFQIQLEPLLRIEKLTKENEFLTHQCSFLTSEVDYMTNGSIPLGETSEEFYRERSPRNETRSNPSTPLTIEGIPGTSNSSGRSIIGRLPSGSHQLSTTNRRIPPPRPPPPSTLKIGWDCTQCTFRNHPDLTLCEQCDMIRALSSPYSSPSASQGEDPLYYNRSHSAS